MWWQRRRKLFDLHAELETIQLFDRLRDYKVLPDQSDHAAQAARQKRRFEILAEIAVLESKTPPFQACADGWRRVVLLARRQPPSITCSGS
jgi:hypothetical protein